MDIYIAPQRQGLSSRLVTVLEEAPRSSCVKQSPAVADFGIDLAHLKEELFDHHRLTKSLSSLVSAGATRAAANSRLVSLQAEMTTAEQKRKRLYQSIANSIVERDDLRGEQITILKAQREEAKAALDKARSRCWRDDNRSRKGRSVLAANDEPAGKWRNACPESYLRAILGKVVVGNKTIRIVGSKDILAGAVMAKKAARQCSQLCSEWRTSQNKAANTYAIDIAL